MLSLQNIAEGPEGPILQASSPIRLSYRTKTKEERMLRKMVNTLFPRELSVSDVKGLDTLNKNAQLILRVLRKARHLLLL